MSQLLAHQSCSSAPPKGSAPPRLSATSTTRFSSGDLDLRYKSTGPEFWFGAGPTYGYFTGYGNEYEGGNSEHEWGWDVNGGLGWRSGGLKPYATVRYIKIKELRTTGAAIGLRF